MKKITLKSEALIFPTSFPLESTIAMPLTWLSQIILKASIARSVVFTEWVDFIPNSRSPIRRDETANLELWSPSKRTICEAVTIVCKSPSESTIAILHQHLFCCWLLMTWFSAFFFFLYLCNLLREIASKAIPKGVLDWKAKYWFLPEVPERFWKHESEGRKKNAKVYLRPFQLLRRRSVFQISPFRILLERLSPTVSHDEW